MGTTEKRYCGFCRSERNVYVKRHVSAADVFWTGVLAVLLMFILWQRFDPRCIAFFACFVGISEFVIQVRARLALNCQYCGFDPILYKKNANLAAAKVRKHLEDRLQDPNALLSSKPFSTLPRRKVQAKPPATVAGKPLAPGARLSTHV